MGRRGITGAVGSYAFALPKIRGSLYFALAKAEPEQKRPKPVAAAPNRRATKFPLDVVAAVRWDREQRGMTFSAICKTRGLPEWRVHQICEYRVAADVMAAPLVDAAHPAPAAEPQPAAVQG